MAQYKIIWSNRAKIKRYEILEFYIKRNKSKTYSIKLNKKFNKELRLLIKQPNLGIKTVLKGVRGLIVDDFILFYEVIKDIIVIHSIWDCRQNPNDLKIK
ncbi:MAG: type II toxin-antitoxin system RelE/ParE family toxin [Bacteroidales bacterium]|nr:type II toxin-antitoxin system RelE/ParE family toxin [Bacteroidales bacterium]